MMTISNQKLGAWGELKAKEYLQQNDYKILVKNYRNCYGEIDLVAQENNFIVFVEVKTRRNNNFGLPQAAVNYSKQMKIKKLAKYFLLNNAYDQCKFRFDVITIFIKNKKAFLKHFINAF